MLSDYDIQFVLKELPKIELSYEKIVHKKVHNAYFIFAIPEGKKHLAWFSTYKNKNVCYLLQIAENKKICHVSFAFTSFTSSLSHGTLLYGTYFTHLKFKTPFFSVEDILCYKGSLVNTFSNLEKLTLCKFIFDNEINQTAFIKKQLMFGLPIIYNNQNNNDINIVQIADTLPYKIKYLQYRFNHKFNEVYNVNIQNFKQKEDYRFQKITITEAVFKVMPDIQNDIYTLFVYNKDNNSKDNINEKYDTAFIPDYKTSVLMNRLFRKIKENDNLDALEESDDENEFENERIDKFVFLDKSHNMYCIFNFKFKKWVPIRLANKGEYVVSKQQLF